MAIVYFPSGTKIAQRNTVSASYEVIAFASFPNTIFFFDTGSSLNAISSSVTDCISSSFALTASVALNAVAATGGGGSSTQFYEFPVQSARISGSFVTAYPNWGWALEMHQNNAAATWQMRLPTNYSSSLTNKLQFFATGSQAGTQNVYFNVQLTAITASAEVNVTGSTPQINVPLSHSFAADQPGGWLREVSLDLTGSAVTSSAFLFYKINRVGGTMTGSVAMVSNMLEWTAS